MTAAAIDKHLAQIKARVADLDARRAARRAAMPTVTSLVEEYADLGATVIYASENGRTYGKPPVYAEVFEIPAGYFPCSHFDVKGRK